ncbi:hypothetical protein BEI59_34425 [Eisenbergiella tayi]|uniref:Type I restriction modification DNA specificity domain-containing protein n=1 Tax=Eisenbergiella tayi TaxID=1432052 RepID=A0A1E3U8K3_9FIRM|nr:restriction endonuclease subunit S [Eisenbergiella tayi]ODR37962.1 hypothetical protein BEI59_34425 [Eisenbergiella tayi]
MKSKLAALCTYMKGKVAVDTLDEYTYISTENMIPNKGGIERASSLPSTQYTQAFDLGDVLVSNIRPYFKKIWMAEYSGGCSNDVLVFRASKGCDPTFLYYVLANNSFFDYATATSKGTKMPRGDKTAIMQYEVPAFDIATQQRIGRLLKGIDTRIVTNKKINDNLEQQAELLYHEWFETVDRDKLPVGWRIVRLGDVATISKKSFNPAKEPEMLLEHYSIPAFDEAHFPVFEPSTAIKSNKFIIDDSCFMISKLNPTTKRVWKPYCLTENAVCSTEFIVYKAKSKEITDFLYSVIDSASFSDFMCSHVTGSTGSRQRTTPSDTLAFELVLPNAEEIAEYQGIVSPMLEQIKCNAIENDRLKRLRDSLLPKLMSGEIDVSGIQL